MLQLALNKIFSIVGGASGLYIYGQLQSYILLISNIGGGSLSNSIISTLASRKYPSSKILLISMLLSLAIVFFMVSIIYFNSELISNLLFGSGNKKLLIQFSLFFVPLICIGPIFLAYLNGLKKIKEYAITVILFSAFSLLVYLIFFFLDLDYFYELILFMPILLAFLAGLFAIKFIEPFKGNKVIGRSFFNNFGKVFFMGAMTFITVPIIQILYRDLLAINVGSEDASYFDALLRFSRLEVMFFSSLATLYFLPKFSEKISSKDARKEILQGLKLFLPLMLIVQIFLLIFSESVIRILFTEDFLPISNLIYLQMVVDLLKVISLFVGVLLIAKKFIFTYFFVEVVLPFSIYFLISSFFEISISAVLTWWIINGLIYLCVIIFVLRSYRII